MPANVERWSGATLPEMHELVQLMRDEGLAPYRWDNDAGFAYAAHAHTYHKVLYCLRGSIRFVLPQTNESIELRAGDRLDLASGTEHSAYVGPDGVACLEAQRD
jgi:cupin superfamily acireductone dioxygenase involved in methionine salvage